MGFLNLFARKPKSGLWHFPAGCFTVDGEGRVLSSTLPQTFPPNYLHDISKLVLETFKRAREIKLNVNELVTEYSALKITAKELRGGAMIFVAPSELFPRKRVRA